MARSTLHAERRCVTAQPFPPLTVPTGLLGGFSHAIMSVGFLPLCRCSVFTLVGTVVRATVYHVPSQNQPGGRSVRVRALCVLSSGKQASGLKARGSKVGRVKAKTVKTLGNM